LLGSWHLTPGTTLSNDQRKQLEALTMQDPTAPSFDQRMRSSIDRLFGQLGANGDLPTAPGLLGPLPPRESSARVRVEFRNTPPGTKITTTTTDPASRFDLDVGFADPLVMLGY